MCFDRAADTFGDLTCRFQVSVRQYQADLFISVVAYPIGRAKMLLDHVADFGQRFIAGWPTKLLVDQPKMILVNQRKAKFLLIRNRFPGGAVQELVHDLRDDGAQESVAGSSKVPGFWPEKQVKNQCLLK